MKNSILMLLLASVLAILAVQSFTSESLVSPFALEASEHSNAIYYFGGISFYITAATILATLSILKFAQPKRKIKIA